MRHLISLIFLMPLVVLLGSHFGVVHPLGDSLAVFRGPMAVVGVLSVLVLARFGPKGAGVIAAALVVWSAYTVLAPRYTVLASTLDAPYVLYQKNMRFDMPSTDPLRDDILAISPDFITLQEVHQRNLPILPALKAVYPSQHFCDFNGVGGEAVLSRWPVVQGTKRCFERRGVAMMQLTTPDGPVWLVSLHLHWPYPYRQAQQVARLLPMLKALDGPMVLGGDFNMVPWSHTMRAISQATGTRRIGTPKYTLALFDGRYYLPINHVLVNANSRPAQTWTRPRLGSDHSGVLARFYIR